MAKPWNEVLENPNFQALSSEEQENARNQYFDEVVATQVSADQLEGVRAQFDTETAPEGTWGEILSTSISRTGQRLKSTAGGIMRAAGELGEKAFAGPTAAETAAAQGTVVDPRFQFPGETELAQARRGMYHQVAGTGTRVATEAQKELAATPYKVKDASAKYFVGHGAETLFGNVLPMLGISLVTKSPASGLQFMGGQVYGEKYAQARSEGRTPEQASMDGAFYALSEVVTERIPLGLALKGGEKYLKKLLKTSGAEGVSEVINSAMQRAYDAGVVTEDTDLKTFIKALTDDEAMREYRDAAVIGTGIGGTMATVAHPFTKSERVPESGPLSRAANVAADEQDAGTRVVAPPEEGAAKEPTITPAAEVAPAPEPSIEEQAKKAAEAVMKEGAELVPITRAKEKPAKPVEEIRLRADGSPFKTDTAAKRALKNRGLSKTHKTVEVAGGFGIALLAYEPKPVTPFEKPAEKEVPPAKAPEAPTPVLELTPPPSPAPAKEKAAQLPIKEPPREPVPIEVPAKPVVEPGAEPVAVERPAKAPPISEAAEAVDASILSAPKKTYINGMIKQEGIKRGSPGYKTAIERIEGEYETRLDKAYAALPFDEYQKRNPETPESLNRQVHEKLQEEYGIKPAEPAAAPVTSADVEAAGKEAATSTRNDLPEPTEAQKKSGNYKLGHVTVQGLPISIENPKGSERKGVDSDGESWSVKMKSDYGYIKGTVGADKDHVDVFIGPKPENDTVYVVDQMDPKTGKLDEHKVMIGFDSQEAAEAGYLENYDKDWKGMGAVTPMSTDTFKEWLDKGSQKKEAAKSKQAKELPKDVQESIDQDAPLNPKVEELVFQLNQAGFTTTRSGDLYGDEVVYVDVDPKYVDTLKNAKLPAGWQVIMPDIKDVDSTILGKKLTEAQKESLDHSRSLQSDPSPGVQYTVANRRLIKKTSGKVSPEEALTVVKALKEAKPPTVERRKDDGRRKRIEEMTPEEMRKELLTDPLTGIGNRRAYEEADKLPTTVSVDLDALKWVNDNMGHPSGDELLKKLGSALSQVTDNAYHISGDEFIVQATTKGEGKAFMEAAREQLGSAVVSVKHPDGTTIKKTGVDFSYGIGSDINEAEQDLKFQKSAREKAGLRPERGREPRGVVKTAAERKPDRKREVEKPAPAPKKPVPLHLIRIKQAYTVKETGKTTTLVETADKLLEEIDAKLDKLYKVKGCLG